MRAVTFDGERLRVEERPEPALAPGQVMVRTRLAGVCNTDLEIVKGYMGFTGVLGHELVGELADGRRVVAEINYACGACAMCARGLARHCPTRTVMGIVRQDGAFAERVAIPLANLHEVPDNIADEIAVFVEPLAAAFEILEQVDIASGTGALVLGDGKLGLLVARVLELAGARVLLVGKHEEHLEIARAWGLGAVTLDRWDRTARDLVVDATGSAEGFAMAAEATRPRGTLVLKSTVAGKTAADLARLVIHEITVVGSRCGPFAPALAALADGAVDPQPLIAGRFPLSAGCEAIARASERGVLKVLLEP